LKIIPLFAPFFCFFDKDKANSFKKLGQDSQDSKKGIQIEAEWYLFTLKKVDMAKNRHLRRKIAIGYGKNFAI